MLNSLVSVFQSGAAPVAATSYESIATVNGSGTSTLTFSSISSAYSHLQLRFSGNDSAGSYGKLTFNSDSTVTNYKTHYLTGSGTAAASGAYAQTYAGLVLAGGAGFVSPTAYVIDILDYTSTNKNKTVRWLGGVDVNGTGGVIEFGSGFWINSSNAINSITLTSNAGTWSTSTKFALYGIKGA